MNTLWRINCLMWEFIPLGTGATSPGGVTELFTSSQSDWTLCVCVCVCVWVCVCVCVCPYYGLNFLCNYAKKHVPVLIPKLCTQPLLLLSTCWYISTQLCLNPLTHTLSLYYLDLQHIVSLILGLERVFTIIIYLYLPYNSVLSQ